MQFMNLSGKISFVKLPIFALLHSLAISAPNEFLNYHQISVCVVIPGAIRKEINQSFICQSNVVSAPIISGSA